MTDKKEIGGKCSSIFSNILKQVNVALATIIYKSNGTYCILVAHTEQKVINQLDVLLNVTFLFKIFQKSNKKIFFARQTSFLTGKPCMLLIHVHLFVFVHFGDLRGLLRDFFQQ